MFYRVTPVYEGSNLVASGVLVEAYSVEDKGAGICIWKIMSELMRLDEEYRSWIQELGDRYKTSQIKASIRVNNEMLMYYWSVGKDITERRAYRNCSPSWGKIAGK